MAKTTRRRKTVAPDTSSGPGRPPGAKNKPVDTVRAELPRCTRCSGTDLKIIRKIGEQEICGVLADGTKFTSIIRRRACCQAPDCGQHQILIVRPFDPKKWKANGGQLD